MDIFKRFFRESVLAVDWYFIVHTDGYVRPAFWNGVVFENRVEVVPFCKIRRVAGRIPHDPEKYAAIVERWEKSRNDPRLALFPQGRVVHVNFKGIKP